MHIPHRYHHHSRSMEVGSYHPRRRVLHDFDFCFSLCSPRLSVSSRAPQNRAILRSPRKLSPTTMSDVEWRRRTMTDDTETAAILLTLPPHGVTLKELKRLSTPSPLRTGPVLKPPIDPSSFEYTATHLQSRTGILIYRPNAPPHAALQAKHVPESSETSSLTPSQVPFLQQLCECDVQQDIGKSSAAGRHCDR